MDFINEHQQIREKVKERRKPHLSRRSVAFFIGEVEVDSLFPSFIDSLIKEHLLLSLLGQESMIIIDERSERACAHLLNCRGISYQVSRAAIDRQAICADFIFYFDESLILSDFATYRLLEEMWKLPNTDQIIYAKDSRLAVFINADKNTSGINVWSTLDDACVKARSIEIIDVVDDPDSFGTRLSDLDRALDQREVGISRRETYDSSLFYAVFKQERQSTCRVA